MPQKKAKETADPHKVIVRMPARLHAFLLHKACIEGTSLQSIVNQAINAHLDNDDNPDFPRDE